MTDIFNSRCASCRLFLYAVSSSYQKYREENRVERADSEQTPCILAFFNFFGLSSQPDLEAPATSAHFEGYLCLISKQTFVSIQVKHRVTVLSLCLLFQVARNSIRLNPNTFYILAIKNKIKSGVSKIRVVMLCLLVNKCNKI